MAEKPARKYPIHVDEPVYNYQQVEIGRNNYWHYSGSSTHFETESEANAAWDSFSIAWDKCEKSAEMIHFCSEIEVSVGVGYGLVNGTKESYGFTIGNLAEAVNETNGISESNLEYVNEQVSDFSEVLSGELKTIISPSVEKMDNLNVELKGVGERLTEKHKELYSTYKSCCNDVGVEIQNFYAEVE